MIVAVTGVPGTPFVVIGVKLSVCVPATCDETLTGTEITDAAAVEAVEVAARERVEDGKVAAVVVEPRA